MGIGNFFRNVWGGAKKGATKVWGGLKKGAEFVGRIAKPIGRLASTAGGIIGMLPGHVGLIGKALFAGGEAIKSLTNSLPNGAVKDKLNNALDKGLSSGGALVNSAQRLAQKVSDSGQSYLNSGSNIINRIGNMATDFANH